MPRSRNTTRKPSQPQSAQPVKPAADPNYIELAYSHYRIRYSRTHWSLYKVTDGRWIRLDAQRIANAPITMRQLVRMCDLHTSGIVPDHLYETALAESKQARAKLQAVPDPVGAPSADKPSRKKPEQKQAKPAAESEELSEPAFDAMVAAETARELARLQAAEPEAEPARKPRKPAPSQESKPAAEPSRTEATLRALDVALAAVQAAQTLISSR